MGRELNKSLHSAWLATSISFIPKLGAGRVNGVTSTANILASLAIHHWGLLRMEQHSMNPMRAVGAVLMVEGVTLIAKF